MTIRTINLLREIIRANDDQLVTIYRRLNQLRELALSPRGPALADEIRREVDELGKEAQKLISTNDQHRKEINKFFSPAA